ncbi:hypothetical protein [Isoalcanivorax indicus]|uniref:hypothetical protein n=1 Tax=Isoalcanivorax indicus TaxID=2202653 RepID=UPI0013C4D7AD|nr:hypothetical protein [Isoalcanivorax indicus]
MKTKLLAAGLILLLMAAARASEPLCAVVVIEIEQEVTFERQGFMARMAINNGLDQFSLDDVRIDVHFADADGNPVVATSNTSSTDALFFITLDQSSGITATDGTGSIAPASTARLEWLIVPAPGAAESPSGTLYYVGAEVAYRFGNDQETVRVAPDTIIVRPMPEIALDYFLTREVIANDPFTPEIEPPVPYTLGLRAINNGEGTARDFRIASSQPRIVENEQGLAVAFEILGSYVGNQMAEPSLNVHLGDLEPGVARVARWIMQSTLSGQFTDFSATYTHAEDLGGALTSLISGINTHFLVKDVLADLPGRDQVRDFLVVQGQDFLLFESEATGQSLPVCQHCQPVVRRSATHTSAARPGGGALITVEPAAVNQGETTYIKLDMPALQGQQVLSAHALHGGEARALSRANVWVSQERDDDKISFNYFLNIFTQQPAELYQVTVGQAEQQGYAPVFQPVPARQVNAGDTLAFLVRAEGPAGTPVTLALEAGPQGAYLDMTDATQGIAYWPVPLSAAGHYQLSFTASNAYGQSQMLVSVSVVPVDEDGDGESIPDWLKEQLGGDPYDPVEGAQDLDGDGFTLLEEYLAGSDPNDPDSTPLTVARLFVDDQQPLDLEAPVWTDMVLDDMGERMFRLTGDGVLTVLARTLPSGELADIGTLALPFVEGRITPLPDDRLLVNGRSESGYQVALLDADPALEAVTLIRLLTLHDAPGDSALGRPALSASGEWAWLPVSDRSAIYLLDLSDGDLRLAQTRSQQNTGLALLSGINAVLPVAGTDLLLVSGASGTGAVPFNANDGTLADYAEFVLPAEEWPAASALVGHEGGDYALAANRASAGMRVLDTSALRFQSLEEKVSHEQCGETALALGLGQRLFYGACGVNGVAVYGYDLGRGIADAIHSLAQGDADPAGEVLTSMHHASLMAPSNDGRHLYVYSHDGIHAPALVRFRHERDWYEEPTDPEEPGEPEEPGDPDDPDDPAEPEDPPGLIDRIIGVIGGIIEAIGGFFRRWFS